MADFLTRLAERTLRTVPVAQPILSSRFAPEPSMAPMLPEVEIWTTSESSSAAPEAPAAPLSPRDGGGRTTEVRTFEPSAGVPPVEAQEPIHPIETGTKMGREEPAGRGPAWRVQPASLHVGRENMIRGAEPNIEEEDSYTITHQPPSASENYPHQPNAAITRRGGDSEEVRREPLRQDVGMGEEARGASLAPAQNFPPVVIPNEQRGGPAGRGPTWRVQPASLYVGGESTMPGATDSSGGNMVIEAGTSESPILEIDEQVHHEHIAPIQGSMQDTSANPKTPTQHPQYPRSYGDQVHERSEGLAPGMEIHEEHIYTSTPSNTLASDETAPPVPSSNIVRGTPLAEESNLVQARSSESSNRPGANAFPEIDPKPHRDQGGSEAMSVPIIEVYEHTPVHSPSMQAAGDSRNMERVEAPEKAEGLIPAINIHEEHIHTLVRQNVPTGNVDFDQSPVREERPSARQTLPVGGERAALVPPAVEVAHPETITSRSEREIAAPVPPVVESHEHIPVYLQPDRSSRKSGSSSEMDAGSSPIVEVHERIVESDRQNATSSPKVSPQSQHRSSPDEDRPLIEEVVDIEEQVETTQLIAPGIVPLPQQPPVSRATQRQSTSNGKQSSMPLTEQHSAKSAPDPASAAPSIRVTIGRIDVRAITPPPAAPAPRPKPGRSGSTLSLDDYLKRNRGGEL